MLQRLKKQVACFNLKWPSPRLILLLLFLPTLIAFQQKPKTNKVQAMVDSIKKVYKNENQDYITDGKQVVWVKSYKRWLPEDLQTLKKENPDALLFLKDAFSHHRLDVLEQLLPTYYSTHGGANAYANDIQQIAIDTRNSTSGNISSGNYK